MPEKGVPYGFEGPTFKEVINASDYPTVGSYFAVQIFETQSIFHEGDERSRTCPGHGYPAYTETIKSSRIFITSSESLWKVKISELYEKNPGRTDVAAFEMNIAKINAAIEVSVTRK